LLLVRLTTDFIDSERGLLGQILEPEVIFATQPFLSNSIPERGRWASRNGEAFGAKFRDQNPTLWSQAGA
jgi:hypothetical protein